MNELPTGLSVLFVSITLLTLVGFYWSVRHSSSKRVSRTAPLLLLVLIGWLTLQAVLSGMGVYSEEMDFLPPRIFVFGLLPCIIVVSMAFITVAGRRFVDSLSPEKLTYIHLVRIPVEIGLWWLFLHRTIPELMTFEGWNFDILAGVTAPLIIYFGYHRNVISKRAILGWNVVCLVLVLFILIIAVLSAPFPLQQLAFEQPNVGLLHFPFSWLPTFIVPVVVFSHLVSIRQGMN